MRSRSSSLVNDIPTRSPCIFIILISVDTGRFNPLLPTSNVGLSDLHLDGYIDEDYVDSDEDENLSDGNLENITNEDKTKILHENRIDTISPVNTNTSNSVISQVTLLNNNKGIILPTDQIDGNYKIFNSTTETLDPPTIFAAHTNTIKPIPVTVNNKQVKINNNLHFKWEKVLSSIYFNPWLYNTSDLIEDILYMFENLGFLEKFFIRHNTMKSFIIRVYNRYTTTPYHSFVHGFDVVHFLYIIHKQMNLLKYISYIDLFSLFIAAICHDIGHFGLNNATLVGIYIYICMYIELSHPIAILYKNQPTLEMMHMHIATDLLINCYEDDDTHINTDISLQSSTATSSSTSIISGLSLEDQEYVIRKIQTLILATDMGKHNEFVENFTLKILSSDFLNNNSNNPLSPSLSNSSPKLPNNNETINISESPNSISPININNHCNINNIKYNENDIDLLMCYIIKSADINNNYKPNDISTMWSTLLQQEMFIQGDILRNNGKNVTPLCDRNNNIPGEKMNLDFIKFVVEPFLMPITTFFVCLSFLMDNLLKNKDECEKKIKEKEKKNDEGENDEMSDIIISDSIHQYYGINNMKSVKGFQSFRQYTSSDGITNNPLIINNGIFNESMLMNGSMKRNEKRRMSCPI